MLSSSYLLAVVIDDACTAIGAAGGCILAGRRSDAYGIRSDLLFDILKRLRDAGISISKQPTM